MHDINGKPLHIGDEITCYILGMCRITAIKEEHTEPEGALITVTTVSFNDDIKLAAYNQELRTHQANVVKVRTWKEMAELALQVQDASNLSAVVHSFSDIIREVRTRLESEGNGGNVNIHKHPVCVLFSDKIASLTGSGDGMAFSDAYKWASEQK